MKGLIIKDLLNLKKGIGTILHLIIIYSFFTYTTGNSDDNRDYSILMTSLPLHPCPMMIWQNGIAMP